MTPDLDELERLHSDLPRRIVQGVAEQPGRFSPDESPDDMVVTASDLERIVESNLDLLELPELIATVREQQRRIEELERQRAAEATRRRVPNERLDELERLANAATPGPWVNPDGYCVRHPDRDNWRTVCQTWKSGQSVEQGIDDMEFIAACRTAVPELIAEVRRLRARVAWTRDVLLRVQAGDLNRIDDRRHDLLEMIAAAVEESRP